MSTRIIFTVVLLLIPLVARGDKKNPAPAEEQAAPQNPKPSNDDVLKLEFGSTEWFAARNRAHDELVKQYALAPFENVKRFPPPYSVLRMNYARFNVASNRWGDPKAYESTYWHYTFRLRNGRVVGGSSTTSGTPTSRPLSHVLESICDMPRQDFEGDKSLLTAQIQGDFSVRDGVPVEKIVARLEDILRNECHQPIRLRLADENRKVIVAEGDFKFTPVVGSDGQNKKEIEVYGRVLLENGMGGGASGNLNKLFDWTGNFISHRIVNEVASPPDKPVTWHMNDVFDRFGNEKVDEALVLKHLGEQTGLTFSKQIRKVRVLHVERAE